LSSSHERFGVVLARLRSQFIAVQKSSFGDLRPPRGVESSLAHLFLR